MGHSLDVGAEPTSAGYKTNGFLDYVDAKDVCYQSRDGAIISTGENPRNFGQFFGL